MSIDEMIETNKEKIKLLFASALIFSLGFASGHYNAESGSAGNPVTIRESGADCASLFKSGGVISPDPELPGEAESGAAGAVLSDSGQKPSTASQAAVNLYASSKNSTLYHSRDCQYVKRIKEENIVWFGSQKEAEAAGKKPHSCLSK